MPKPIVDHPAAPPSKLSKLSNDEVIDMRRAHAMMPPVDKPNAKLSERFLMPPFTVLDARQGYWQTRKRAWLSIGIKSELGRGEGANSQSQMALELAGGFQNHPAHRKPNATPGGAPMPATKLKDGKTQRGDGRGHPIPGGGTGKNSAYMFKTADGYKSLKEQEEAANGKRFAKAFNIGMQASAENGWQIEDNQGSGTSIFDPILCELAYRWFSPVGGRILDPFAGGSVRGIVAAKLRRSYTGIDLRAEQIEANEVQRAELCPDAELRWIVGDSRDVLKDMFGTVKEPQADMVFSCPPYADLEVYSDDPRDISTMSYEDFLTAYREIIMWSCMNLRDNRFACFVVGDMRDKEGIYRGFVADTIEAFEAAGLKLYNDAVLVTSVGSLPIRVGKQFASSRKLGKTHQNVLVFVKGDPVMAARACGTVDVADLAMPPIVPGETRIAVAWQDLFDTPAPRDIMAWLFGRIQPREKDQDVVLVEGGLLTSAAALDLVRDACRRAEVPVPRVWVSDGSTWNPVPENAVLTINGASYLVHNPAVFNTAPTHALGLEPTRIDFGSANA